MKKSLLFLATAALFASCSDDLLEPNNGFQASNEKGITFQVVDDATRGMIDPAASYDAFFFAEQDRVSIWSSKALKGWDYSHDSWTTPSTTWNDVAAIYKATKSKGNPNFTSTDDANLLGFNGTTEAQFFVAYPIGQTLSAATVNNVTTFTVTPVMNLTAQSMSGYMNMDARLMYDYAKGKKSSITEPKAANKSVGETVALQFMSPLSTALFKCSDLATYGDVLGKLQSVTFSSDYSPLVPNSTVNNSFTVPETDLVTVGGKKYLYGDVIPKEYNNDGPNGGKGTVKTYQLKEGVTDEKAIAGPINLTRDQFKYTVKADGSEEVAFAPTTSFAVRTAKLDVTGSTINQDTEMNLFVLPTTGHSADKPETYTITYTFDNVTLTYKHTTQKNFTPNKGALTFTLDISETFPYIVTNKVNGKRNLIVNSKKLSGVLNADKNAVTWGGADIPFDEFDKILINGSVDEFGDDDWTCLNKFAKVTNLEIKNSTKELKNVTGLTSLTKLTANNIKSVSKDAFNSNNATKLTDLYLENVTSFAKQTAAGVDFSMLDTLDLSSYAFTEYAEVSPEVFFNDNTKGYLQYIDIAAVTSLSPIFGYERNILFTGYAKLTDITLNEEGTKISANEFKDCTSLKNVGGYVIMSTAASAFEKCIALGKVSVVSPKENEMVIPASAFKSSTVKSIIDKSTGKQVVPTSIGASAFEGNTKIDYMDLRKAQTIGASAFNGATGFIGTNADNKKNNVVTLIVGTVEENAFKDTQVIRFQLINATTTKAGSLASTELKQIKYRKEGLTIDDYQVSDPSKVDVFINSASKDGAKFTKTGYVYHSVTEDTEDWNWDY